MITVTSASLRCVFFAAISTLTLAVASGCHRDPASNDPLAIPAANTVRVIAGGSPPATPDHAGWTWSVLGERNWTQPQAAGTQLTLGGSYPINDVQRLHGCNTWNCDLALDRSRSQPDQATWTLTLHGSNGMTAHSTGTIPLGGSDPNGAVSALQDRTATADLPAQIHLAHLGDHDITLAISK